MSSGAGFAEPDPSNITRFIYARLEHPWKLHLETMRGKIVQQKLYNLEIDPEERTDLSQSQPEITQRLKERILAALKTQQPPTPPQFSNIAGVRPRWVFPKVSRTYSYDDLRGEFRLEWTGDLKKNYVIHYIAGEGALRVEGRLDVQGTAKKFKAITRRYWNTWIVPYRTFKIRVGVTGQKNELNNLWSEWLELKATP